MDNENQNVNGYPEDVPPQRFEDAPTRPLEEGDVSQQQFENATTQPLEGSNVPPQPNNVPPQYPYSNVPPQQYQPQYPYPNGQPPIKKKKKHMSLAIASLVLSGVSLVCCWAYALGIIPALIGAILGLIALVKGDDKSVKIMGGVGMGLGIVGFGLSVIMLIQYISLINWDNVTLENLQTFTKIDPNNEDQIRSWLQQFFREDISRYY